MSSITISCYYIAVVLTLSSITGVLSQLCPANSYTYGTGMCISLMSSSTSSFSQATTACQSNDRDLVTIATMGQLFALRGYVRSLGTDGGQYWIGYQYTTNQLIGVDGLPAPSLVTDALINAPSNGLCTSILNNGSLVNVLCTTNLNGYLCQFGTTSPTVSTVRVNGSEIDTSTLQTVPLGVPLTLSCDFTNTSASSIVQWTVDGTVIVDGVVTLADKSNSVLTMGQFLTAGVYMCTVTNSDGRTAQATILLYGSLEDIRFVPGPLSVSGFIASPNTNTSLLIEWIPPLLAYVPSALLLQYTLYYSTDSSASISDSMSVPSLTTGSDGMGSYILENLNPRAVYYLRMRAINAAGDGDILESLVQATTFGIAPSTAPSNLKLSRNQDNSALLAEWDPIVTSPPVGDIAFNQIEFRDRGSSVVNIIFVSNRFSFASIFNVSNALSYEVRIRSGVQSTREPVTYVYGPYTTWESVSGIATEIPSVPTIEPVSDNTLTIAVSVVVPIVVIVLLIVTGLISVVFIVTYCKPRPQDDTDGGGPLTSNKVATDGRVGDIEEKM